MDMLPTAPREPHDGQTNVRGSSLFIESKLRVSRFAFLGTFVLCKMTFAFDSIVRTIYV
jgi:hypothetical protein